jgi:rhodanese-related sulfurtransferase
MKLILIISSIFIILFSSILLFTDLCIACGCVICVNPDFNKEPVFKQISPQEFNEKLNSDVILIDIRTLDEFNSGHIIGAENIDFYSSSFRSNLAMLDKNKSYLIYCRTASRTSQATNIMRDLGFSEVYELSGGIVAWQSAGFSIVSN